MSAIEYESMEQKYVETKAKLKKTLQYNERYNLQIQKMNKRLKRLENENKQLEHQVNQLQSTAHDTSESDVSSTANLHYERAKMGDLVNSKNQQISDLLKDIEEIENENIVLRNKLSETKDQLAMATTEIATMTETLKTENARFQKREDLFKNMSLEIERLKEESQLNRNKKEIMEDKLKTFTKETKDKEAGWKDLIDKKENEIENLKTLLIQLAPNETSSAKYEEKTETDASNQEDYLKMVLLETETQLDRLKKEMENCTLELRESAKIINKLKGEREMLEKKREEWKENEREMKVQLKRAHDRCQTIQTEVEYANKLAKIFETELSTLKDNIKENGHIEILANMEELQTLKLDKLLHEKHIVGLVKDINKLQEMCNIFEIENVSLREQLGLTAEDIVDMDPSYLNQSKKQAKLIDKLQLDYRNAQEEKVALKLENKHLRKQVASNMQPSARPQEGSQNNLETDILQKQMKNDRSADVRALSEENEALRKGLHEILNSVKSETSPRELKSDVLERLLRALDVKHISGWYHPAMRLQAELHTLEGVNSELREQLCEVRTEFEKYKTSLKNGEDNLGESQKVLNKTDGELSGEKGVILEDALGSDSSCLDKIKLDILKIFMYLNEADEDVTTKLENEFEYLKKHVDILHTNCKSEKAQLLENIKDVEKNLLKPSEIDANMSTAEMVKLIQTERKKTNFTFKEINKLQAEIEKTKLTNRMMLKHHALEIETLLKKTAILRSTINLKLKQSINYVDAGVHKEVQNSLNEIIKKYRCQLTEVDKQENHSALEIKILVQKESDLIKANTELKDKLSKSMNKLNQEMFKQEPNVLPLSQKLANSEVLALSEMHRADHINNLYELVKEQLKKSEEKFVEFSKYGDGLLQKNLVLQERVAELEDKIMFFIDPEIHKELRENFNALVIEKECLTIENDDLVKKLHECTDFNQQTSTWTKEKEQELLDLKHEIVDLTATSEDKTMIDQLYSDLTKSRSELRELQLQVDFLRKEMLSWESRYTKLCAEINNQRDTFETEKTILDKKIGILQDVVLKQRIQYHGCTPLTIQEIFVEKLQTIHKESHETFILLQNAKTLENQWQSSEKCDIQKSLADQSSNYCRNHQVEYLQQKVLNQDGEIEKLEKELFSAYKILSFSNNSKPDISVLRKRTPMLVMELVSQESLDPIPINNDSSNNITPKVRKTSSMMMLRNVESQTDLQKENKEDQQLTILKVQLNNLQAQLFAKDNHIVERERLLTHKDKELAEAKEQLEEKQSELTILENSLKDIRGKIPTQHNCGAGDGAGIRSNFLDEQIMALRITLQTSQDRIKQKDLDIIKYQTLLKEDRDKHSLAAAHLQQELIILRKALVTEQQNTKSLQQETIISKQKSAAVEKYVAQVRALEKHLAELHTQLAQLQAQLQNAHQEATRWRQMAQERLVAMQDLGKSLNEQHNKELSSYKTDYEKLKELSEEEISKKPVTETKIVGHIDPEILKLCREKDDKIQELLSKLKQLESGDIVERPFSLGTTSLKEKFNIVKEHEILRTKYDSISNRERGFKEEIKDLKEQLSKRSNLSARSQKPERSVKEQLQKRISFLEREIEDLGEKLTQQQLINEKHKLKANEDFEKWKKLKYWQENCQKYKSISQEREEEIHKLQQTCTGYRTLIERLEREKINLENRVKTLKLDQRSSIVDPEKALLKDENDRLTCELAMLQAKMEMRQQGSGALGAALMQEKLEAQERKITILELSAKGTVEVRNELERLQTSLSQLQKHNLCLEAENLDFKMDLEKYSKETPHLQEQIQHLESYIELLKNENQKQLSSSNDVPRVAESSDDKKVSQLERTVFILKRVVEKLQVENKRLVSGKRPLSERSPSADKLRRDYLRLKEQYTDSLHKIKELESQVQTDKKFQKNQPVNEKTEQLRLQLIEVKEQLLQKTQLPEKVKVLLHTAAAREKQLLKEMAELKCEAHNEKDYQVIDIPSPIEELSEVSSDA